MFDAIEFHVPLPEWMESVRRPLMHTAHASPLGFSAWEERPYDRPFPSRDFLTTAARRYPRDTDRKFDLSNDPAPKSSSRVIDDDYTSPNIFPPVYSSSSRAGPLPLSTFFLAASNLHTTLKLSTTHLRGMETSFQNQMSRITEWLPSEYLDSLWSLYLSWNGIPVDNQRGAYDDSIHHTAATAPELPASMPKSASSPSAAVTLIFDDISKRFTNDLTNLKQSAPPSLSSSLASYSSAARNSEVTPRSDFSATTASSVLKTTLRKLRISLEAIEELMQVVKKSRDRMGILVDEMRAAAQLLDDLRRLFDLPRKQQQQQQKSGLGGGCAEHQQAHQPSPRYHWRTTDHARFDFAWPEDYGEI